MAWLKKNLLFTIIMVLLAAVLAVEIFFVLGRRQEARQAESEFQQRVEEHQRLTQKAVLPHENNVALTQAEIDRQQEELLLYNRAMVGDPTLRERFQQYPRSRADAFFDIASFVEEYRQRANTRGVGINDNEHFGFAAYSAAGPDEREIPGVYRQRLIIAEILDRLFEAQPQALVAVQRPGEGRANGAEEGMTMRRGAGAGQQGMGQQQQQQQQFRIDPQFSVAIPNVAQTLPFQVTFTGRSDTLREFLNNLTSYELPLVVRTVESMPEGQAAQAQPAAGGRRRGTVAPQAEAAGDQPQQEEVPLVLDNVSRFTVALEFVEVEPAGEGSR